MTRPKRDFQKIIVNFDPDILERIDRVLGDEETRSSFIRTAALDAITAREESDRHAIAIMPSNH